MDFVVLKMKEFNRQVDRCESVCVCVCVRACVYACVTFLFIVMIGR